MRPKGCRSHSKCNVVGPHWRRVYTLILQLCDGFISRVTRQSAFNVAVPNRVRGLNQQKLYPVVPIAMWLRLYVIRGSFPSARKCATILSITSRKLGDAFLSQNPLSARS